MLWRNKLIIKKSKPALAMLTAIFVCCTHSHRQKKSSYNHEFFTGIRNLQAGR